MMIQMMVMMMLVTMVMMVMVMVVEENTNHCEKGMCQALDIYFLILTTTL